MKKWIALLLALLMAACLFAACGDEEEGAPADDEASVADVADDAEDGDEDAVDEGDDELEIQKQTFLALFEATKEQQNELVAFMNSAIEEGYPVEEDTITGINSISDNLTSIQESIDAGELDTMPAEEISELSDMMAEYGANIAVYQGLLEGLMS